MKMLEWTTIDRANWPAGDWDGEPDKMQWADAATGLPCLIVRHSHSGHLCGYVGIAESHPMFGVGYDDVRFPSDDNEDGRPDVHGGLTFADKCQPGKDEGHGVCHLPDAGEPDHVWWLGFDCAHSGDRSPRDAMYERDKGYPFTRGEWETYKGIGYVKAQCAKLAKQLAAAA